MATQPSSSTATHDMLAQIETGTGLEAVNAVRYMTSPPGPLFIHQLDELIGPQRSSGGTSTLQRGDMIEIIGASGSGKTSLLTFLLLTHLLPYSTDIPLPHNVPLRVCLGGKSSSAALLLCVSHPSPIPALARAMRGHIRDCLSPLISFRSTAGSGSGAGHGGRFHRATEDGIDGVVRAAMARLRVMRVRPRYRSWALGLMSLSHPPRAGGAVAVAGEEEGGSAPTLVCLDGLSRAFWPERWAEEERSLGVNAGGDEPGPGSGPRPRTRARAAPPGIKAADEVGMRDVMAAIGRLRGELGCVVVTTTQGLWHEKTPGFSAPTDFFAPYLPAPYPSPWAVSRGYGHGSGSGSDPHADPSTQAHNAAEAEIDDGLDSAPVPTPRDAAHWPLTFQLTLTGRARGLQMPTDTMLHEALTRMHGHGQGRGAAGQGLEQGNAEMYAGLARMRGADAPLGARGGARFGMRIGGEGVETVVEA